MLQAKSSTDLYLIVNAVEGLPSGAYYFDRERSALELLKEGDFRQDAGHLGLGQEIPADASVDVFFLSDLKSVLERFGNRGYRAAQLEAAIMGGKLYLAAYAQRLGASGLTFFDDDVTDFFSPHAAGKSVMFLIALGKSARRLAGAQRAITTKTRSPVALSSGFNGQHGPARTGADCYSLLATPSALRMEGEAPPGVLSGGGVRDRTYRNCNDETIQK